MCQALVPECPEDTGTPCPAEQQAISFSSSFCHFTLHPAYSNLFIVLPACIILPTLHAQLLIHFIYYFYLVSFIFSFSISYHILRKGRAHTCAQNKVYAQKREASILPFPISSSLPPPTIFSHSAYSYFKLSLSLNSETPLHSPFTAPSYHDYLATREQ
jgi:hypothetical protein